MSVTLILGDVHLGKGLGIGKQGIGSALNSRIVDQLGILEWVLEKAIHLMATNIIITGDIFEDTKPHPTFISLFLTWLKKCVDNNISVHIIVGNHDILRSGQHSISALDIISSADIDGIYVYKNINTIHTQGASFTLMPFRDRRSFNTDSNSDAILMLKEKIPFEVSEIKLDSAKVLIGHLALEGSIPVGDEIDDMTNELFCPLDMFKDYDYVWMGHVHRPQVLSKTPYISHIGSMDLSDFGETDHKKVIVVFDPNSSNVFDYIEIPTRPLKQISVSVPENITNTTEYVIEDIRKKHKTLSKSIVRVNIGLNSPDLLNVDRQQVEACLNSLGTYHIFRIDEEKKISSIKKAEDENNKIDNTVNETTAIKMYANLNIEKKDRDNFVSLSNSIVDEYFQSKEK